MFRILVVLVILIGVLAFPMPLNAAIAYQECIPEGVGSQANLASSYGEPNWFAVSSEHKTVPVYNCGPVGSDLSIPGISINSDESLIIDPQCPRLGWVITDTITIPQGSYTLEGGEVFMDNGELWISDVYATFYDYVSGSGVDLYHAENTPQAYIEHWYPFSIEKITCMAVAEGTIKFLVRFNDKTYSSPAIQANGLVTYDLNLNPITSGRWEFTEIDNMELGMRLVNAVCYRVWTRIKFEI